MTIKELNDKLTVILREYQNTHDLTVKIEYPNGNCSSDMTDINSIDWDESDFILSYYKYGSN